MTTAANRPDCRSYARIVTQTADITTTPVLIRRAHDVYALLAERGSQGPRTRAIIILALGGIFMDA